jgi:hypothetical protein
MLHSGGSQQLWTNGAVEVVASTSSVAQKFTGTIPAGKLVASNVENGEPGGTSFQANASVGDGGLQAPARPPSGVFRGSGAAVVPM